MKEETLALINKIENTTNFYPNKGPLCDWCEYRNICPAWNNNADDGGMKFLRQKKLGDFGPDTMKE